MAFSAIPSRFGSNFRKRFFKLGVLPLPNIRGCQVYYLF
jgi:hypothetical protein